MPDWTPLVVLLVALLTLLVARSTVSRVTVLEYQRGLKYVDGHYRGVLEPGAYWVFTPTTVIRAVDTRATVLSEPGQEVITSDGIGVKLSVTGQYRVVDPAVAHNEVQNYLISLYSFVQVALREVVGARTIDDVLQHRETIGPEILERSAPQATAIGLELTDLDVKDVMLPGPTKRLLAQVVEARQQGLAALERARGETAALRNLANAASMLEDKPALLQLRMLHQLETTSGNTVVLGLSPTAVPLAATPKSASGEAEPGSSTSA
jgi:regulator of protease activity HflC (stomatin/prohibitin superfamily)